MIEANVWRQTILYVASLSMYAKVSASVWKNTWLLDYCNTRAKVFRFNQNFWKVLKCSAKFQCRSVVGKIGVTGRQIFTTGRQFFRPVHSYFRPWQQVSSGCYLWVNQCSSYTYTLISSATRLVLQVDFSRDYAKSISRKTICFAPSQLHTSNSLVDGLHQWSGTLSALWLAENLLLHEQGYIL